MVSLWRALGCAPWLRLLNWSLLCDHSTDIVPTCPLCFRVSVPLLLIVALIVYQRHKIWAPVSVQEFHRLLDPQKTDVCWLAFVLGRVFWNVDYALLFTSHHGSFQWQTRHWPWSKTHTKGQWLLTCIPYSSQSGAGQERLTFQQGNILYISALTMSFYFPESALKIMLTFMANTLWITIFMSECIGMKINQWKN